MRAEINKLDSRMNAADYASRAPAVLNEICRECYIWQDRIELTISSEADLYSLPADDRIEVVNIYRVFAEYNSYLYELKNERIGIEHSNVKEASSPAYYWMEGASVRIFPRPLSECKLKMECILANNQSSDLVPKHLVDRYAYVVAQGVVFYHLSDDAEVILQHETQGTYPSRFLSAQRNFRMSKLNLKNQIRNTQIMEQNEARGFYG